MEGTEMLFGRLEMCWNGKAWSFTIIKVVFDDGALETKFVWTRSDLFAATSQATVIWEIPKTQKQGKMIYHLILLKMAPAKKFPTVALSRVIGCPAENGTLFVS